MKKTFAGSLLAVTMLVTGVIAGGAHAQTGSCAGASTGGDWAQHGGDVAGTRSQPAEDQLNAGNVLNLSSKWNFSVATLGAKGNIESIPVEADGCVVVLTSGGTLVALNADDGSKVWNVQLDAGASTSSPAINNGVAYAIVPTKTTSPSGKGLHINAYNLYTGARIYDGPTIVSEPGAIAVAGAMASAVYFDGMLFIGLTNDENTPLRVGGFALVKASDGTLISREYNVPDDEAAAGFNGCSLWSTASIDPVTKMGYVGTGQPAAWTDKESERCNAIVKFDLNSTSPNFGKIIGAVKGVPDDAPYIDVDFGSAPTLLKDGDGRQIVAQLQKAGQVTAAYTRHMTLAWRTPVSPAGAALGNYTASATDGKSVFTVGAYPGQLFSLNGSTGLPNWVTPVVSPVASNSVAYANGVVYYSDEKGFLNAYDSTNGLQLFAHPMKLDNSACTRNQAGGVAIARHRVIAACGPVITSFGL